MQTVSLASIYTCPGAIVVFCLGSFSRANAASHNLERASTSLVNNKTLICIVSISSSLFYIYL